MATVTATHPLVAAITAALDAGDRDALADLYAPDAVHRPVSPANPPSSPLVLEGDAVREFVRSIPTELRISMQDHIVGTDGRIGFRTLCELPSGGRVVSFHVIRPDEAGRILTHDSVEAGDS